MCDSWFWLSIWNQLQPNQGGKPVRDFLDLDHLRWEDSLNLGHESQKSPQIWSTPCDSSPHKRTWMKKLLVFHTCPHSQVHLSCSWAISSMTLEPTSSRFQNGLKTESSLVLSGTPVSDWGCWDTQSHEPNKYQILGLLIKRHLLLDYSDHSLKATLIITHPFYQFRNSREPWRIHSVSPRKEWNDF